MQAIATSRASTRALRLLLLGGMIGPALFIVVFLIEEAVRPGYSVWRYYVSQLGTGPGGWVQDVSFVQCGLGCLGFAVALRMLFRGGKAAVGGPVLLAIYALAMLAAGIFPTDPAMGYPPGAVPPAHASPHGMVHGLAGAVVFTILPITCFVVARRFVGDAAWRGWAVYTAVTGAVMLVFGILSIAAAPLEVTGHWPNAPIGILQRTAIIVGFTWISLLAARLYRDQRLQMADPSASPS
jgi:hypothetical membrane protein